MAQYRRALAEYQAARAAYAAAADAYWNSISQQRRQRNAKRANHEKLSIDDYVLTQPPRLWRAAETARSVEAG